MTTFLFVKGLTVKVKKRSKGPKTLRLPGGLQLSAKDLNTLIVGGGTKGKILMKKMINPESEPDPTVFDIDSDGEPVIPRPIQVVNG